MTERCKECGEIVDDGCNYVHQEFWPQQIFISRNGCFRIGVNEEKDREGKLQYRVEILERDGSLENECTYNNVAYFAIGDNSKEEIEEILDTINSRLELLDDCYNIFIDV